MGSIMVCWNAALTPHPQWPPTPIVPWPELGNTEPSQIPGHKLTPAEMMRIMLRGNDQNLEQQELSPELKYSYNQHLK